MGGLLGSTPSWCFVYLLISLLMLIQMQVNRESDERKEGSMRAKESRFCEVFVVSFVEMADDILGGPWPRA